MAENRSFTPLVDVTLQREIGRLDGQLSIIESVAALALRSSQGGVDPSYALAEAVHSQIDRLQILEEQLRSSVPDRS